MKTTDEKMQGDPTPWDDPRYPGDQTCDKPKYTGDPRPMEETHFYYFGPGKDGSFRTLAFHHEGGKLPDDATLKGWIEDARAGNATGAIADLDEVEWHRPGYLAFFVDLPGWQFLVHDGKNQALHFADVKRGGKQKCHPNYSFFNAGSHPLEVDGRRHELLVVENHHLKAPNGGGPAKYAPRAEGDEDDYYKFDIYIGMPVEGAPGKKLWLILDPGGKNMGPP